MIKRVIILGSTGSIGMQTLDIIRDNPDKFCVAGLTCHSNIDTLIEQIQEFHPSAVSVGSDKDASRIKSLYKDIEVFSGENGLCDICEVDSDIILNSLLGISGLAATCAAIKQGRDIAFANKETLVAGGSFVTNLCLEHNVKLLPVDSEHSAIFQCLMGNKQQTIKRILLTASGGPFRGYSLKELENVTLEQTLKHPKWTMGRKITVDSATLMNKGLEVIEAKWLFDVPANKIDVHVHPQSIVHSMVEFEDSSVMAQLGNPDMRIPIGLALNYPNRLPYKGESLDFFTQASDLHFEKPDMNTFKCLAYAYDALRLGGSYPIALNGANEELVAMYLNRKISFLDIQNTIGEVLDKHNSIEPTSVEEILAVDRESRLMARRIIGE